MADVCVIRNQVVSLTHSWIYCDGQCKCRVCGQIKSDLLETNSQGLAIAELIRGLEEELRQAREENRIRANQNAELCEQIELALGAAKKFDEDNTKLQSEITTLKSRIEEMEKEIDLMNE